MADLVVELYGTQAGVLAGTWRSFDFQPPHKRAYLGLARDIAGFAANLLAGHAIGVSSQHR